MHQTWAFPDKRKDIRSMPFQNLYWLGWQLSVIIEIDILELDSQNNISSNMTFLILDLQSKNIPIVMLISIFWTGWIHPLYFV